MLEGGKQDVGTGGVGGEFFGGAGVDADGGVAETGWVYTR